METRRRRRSSFYGQEDEKANEDIITTAPSGIETAVSIDEDEDEKEDETAAGLMGPLKDKNRIQSQNTGGNNHDEGDEEEEEEEEEGVLNLPVVAQITHDSGHSTVAAATTGHNGVVIVQTNTPPKVNPQTHAVFELLPVNHEDTDGEGGDDYDENGHFIYQEEISPVSTTAIWSTGEDDPIPYSQAELDTLNDDYQDTSDIDDDVEGGKPRPSKKPSKRPTKKPTKEPSRSPNKRPNRRPNQSGNKKRRQGNKNKKSPVRRGNGNNNRRRPNKQNNDFNGLRATANRRRKQNLNNRDIKRNQLNNDDHENQGTNTFTKTETLTRTGTGNDDRNVNCIIINKTTTPRPFWGLFGRSADGDVEAPTARPYGRRKRINFSLPA